MYNFIVKLLKCNKYIKKHKSFWGGIISTKKTKKHKYQVSYKIFKSYCKKGKRRRCDTAE